MHISKHLINLHTTEEKERLLETYNLVEQFNILKLAHAQTQRPFTNVPFVLSAVSQTWDERHVIALLVNEKKNQ